MHISFAVFADAANLSQEGKLNILGVFDAVQVAGKAAHRAALGEPRGWARYSVAARKGLRGRAGV